jgi:predicted permease
MSLIRDVRYGLRMLRRSPVVTVAAILSLALGIGANAAVFTWVRAVILNPFPGVPAADELFVIAARDASGNYTTLSHPEFLDIQGIAGLTGVIAQDFTDVSIGAESDSVTAQKVAGGIVSGNYFDLVGVTPVIGRGFRADEDQAPGRSPVVVIGHHLWDIRYGRRTDVVGSQILLNGSPFTIIGVAPAGFDGTFMGPAVELWVPTMMQPQVEARGSRLTDRGDHWLQIIARLAPGSTLSQARAAVDARGRRLAEANPSTNKGRSLALLPPSQSPWGVVDILGPVVLLVFSVVGVVLLITCANVANLLLARALRRRQEVAIRLALGAGQGRLVRQWLTESVLLAAFGGIAGLLIARWTSGLLMAFLPQLDFRFSFAPVVDAQVLAFAALVTVITGLLFGLAPAIQFSRPSLVQIVQNENRTIVGGMFARRIGGLLVIGQVSLTLILLIGAALFLQSLRYGQGSDVGFRRTNLLYAEVNLFPNNYTPERGAQFYRTVMDRLAALPVVESASIGRQLPLGPGGGGRRASLHIEGYVPRPNEEIAISYNTVAPRYFATMGIPLTRGRDFTWDDNGDAPGAIVINETMAQRYWPTRNPLGARVRRGDRWFTVVGIVPTGKYRSLNEEPTPFLYVPLLQEYAPTVHVHVRTRGAPAAALPLVRQIVAELDPALPLYDVMTAEQHLSIVLLEQRIGGSLLGVFGGLALVLASIGLYGVMAYAVSQRTREIGIRMALGATPERVRVSVVRDGLLLAGAGVVLGLTAAWLGADLIQSQLTGVSAHDPVTFATVATALLTVAFLACYVPARRASGVDPAVALRVS